MCELDQGQLSSQDCDLSIQKEVSVNGSEYFDANTEAEAPSAIISDDVIWRISATNTTAEEFGVPTGDIRVSDVLPAGVSYVSSTASVGTYNNSTNIWEFSLNSSTTYPVTLTINTLAASEGVTQNTAAFSEYECDGWCTFSDSNASNDSDDAYIRADNKPELLAFTTSSIDEEPQVLAASSTLADTGMIPIPSILAGIFITAGVATTFHGRKKNLV